MSANDAIRDALEIAGAFSVDDPKRMDCEYYNGDKKKYCKCTTQTTCEKCRFYFPNAIATRQILADYIVSLPRETESEEEWLGYAEDDEDYERSEDESLAD